ncbi:MAG: hydroxymethylglutaryl-CoA synthase, partial [Chloroflexi bacterium]|nr:hydroxymethylglutaryl-CoA synthase [Chloroflexota bacterium]
MTAGIVGYGAYIPRNRLKTEDIAKVWQKRASVKEKAVPGLDEDVITMGVEAAQRALAQCGVSPSDIEAVYLATVSSPYLVKSSAAIVAEVLDIPPTAACIDVAGSTRAVSQALQACLDAVQAKRIKYGLVVAADMLTPEPSDHLEGILGAGAGAVVIGARNLLAEVTNSASHTSDFTSVWQSNKDRWIRRHDDPRLDQVFGYPVAIGSAVKTHLQAVEESAGSYSQVVSYMAEPNAANHIARAVGVTPDKISNVNLLRDTGDAGCATLMLGLANALDQASAGQKILAVSYGNGAGADSFTVTTTAALAKRRNGGSVQKLLSDKKYIDYVTYGKHMGVFNMNWLADPWSSYVA